MSSQQYGVILIAIPQNIPINRNDINTNPTKKGVFIASNISNDVTEDSTTYSTGASGILTIQRNGDKKGIHTLPNNRNILIFDVTDIHLLIIPENANRNDSIMFGIYRYKQRKQISTGNINNIKKQRENNNNNNNNNKGCKNKNFWLCNDLGLSEYYNIFF